MENHSQPVSIFSVSENEPKSFFGIIIHSFFIVPFLIAVFCVLLFTAMALLTREHQTPYDLLEDVKTGGLTKRWQAAFELSRILANPKLIPQEERFAAELARAFKNSQNDEPLVRQYLALAMGRMQDPNFYEPLTAHIKEERSESLYAVIFALGMLKDKRAVGDLLPYLDHPEPRIRSVTVVSLGTIGDPSVKEKLKISLNDPEPNVQWGAAIALAHLKDRNGQPVLLKLLDRAYYKNFPEIDPQEANDLILAAIEAAGYLDDPALSDQIKKLLSADPHMKIRAAASRYAALKSTP